MRITKRQLRRIIKEEKLKILREQTVSTDAGQFREEIEYGDWPRRGSFEWDYVESEGANRVRFDWKGRSMWFDQGYIEGDVPSQLKEYLWGMGYNVEGVR
jgi:hypothetical protein